MKLYKHSKASDYYLTYNKYLTETTLVNHSYFLYRPLNILIIFRSICLKRIKRFTTSKRNHVEQYKLFIYDSKHFITLKDLYAFNNNLFRTIPIS